MPIPGSDYWNSQWDKIDLPQANRCTFFWTRLPPIVDLQADEPVGGNIVLPGNARQFHLEANFMTGGDKGGEALQINFESVECPRQGASQ